MKVAVMQPYFFPYIGYFQLINSVDTFVIYDNIQYTKKGYINRNKLLLNGKEKVFTIPIKKESDYLDIIERSVANSWITENSKLISLIEEAYRKAPNYNDCIKIISNCIEFKDQNLFNYIYNSVKSICNYLEIETKIIISSKIKVNRNLKGQERVIEICKYLETSTYLNPIGGKVLYNKNDFKKHNIDLFFLKSKNIQYNQFNKLFVPWLSIIDLMMFNKKDFIKKYLTEYTLTR